MSVLLLAGLAEEVSAQAGDTRLASVAIGGVPADGDSTGGSISADGRFIAFTSAATNLVPGDTNGRKDAFVRDTLIGTTTRVSVSSSGAEGDGDSDRAVLSADGSTVAFDSLATNLVPGDGNGRSDVFVHDMLTGATTIVSVQLDGTPGADDSYEPSLSGDGRFVSFTSWSSLTPDDTRGLSNFVRDRILGTTKLASITPLGAPVGYSTLSFAGASRLSGDGHLIAFEAYFVDDIAPHILLRDLVAGLSTVAIMAGEGPDLTADGTRLGCTDAFQEAAVVKDLLLNTITPVSVSSSGLVATGFGTVISDDHRFAAFSSASDLLVSDDTNDATDAFVHDGVTGETVRISVGSTGAQGIAGDSRATAISGDGRRIVFSSNCSNLGPAGLPLTWDVFVHLRGTWTDLGGALAGSAGAAVLAGSGPLTGNKPGFVTLAQAAPLAPSMLFASLWSHPLPFKGGTLVPGPPLLGLPFTTDTVGAYSVSFTWPPFVPASTAVFLQAAIADVGAVNGVSLSNALEALTP